VEFALVIPFALLLVMGIIQLGLMFSARELLNEAAFQAARAGSFQNAQIDKMNQALDKALIPFYQDTADRVDFRRLQNAMQAAQSDAGFIKVELLNPTPEAFADFGMTHTSAAGVTTKDIPNDNLEYRQHAAGALSGLSIQDANALKIKVTYGYELKVPLMQTVFRAIMCGIDSGLGAFGHGDLGTNSSQDDCNTYYNAGRIPLVAYATVQMQTPAREQP
jgi:hypothetical protein